MTALRDTSEEAVERKKTAAFILGVGVIGFWFLGLIAFLASPRYHGSFTGNELVVAGGLATATGIFLCVALVAVWFDKPWVGQWHD